MLVSLTSRETAGSPKKSPENHRNVPDPPAWLWVGCRTAANVEGEISTKIQGIPASGDVSQLLEMFPNFWRCFPTSGDVSQLLEMFPNFWRCFPTSGDVSQLLEMFFFRFAKQTSCLYKMFKWSLGGNPTNLWKGEGTWNTPRQSSRVNNFHP